MKLNEYLKEKKQTVFAFTSVEKQMTESVDENGQPVMVFIFHLAQPIPEVEGSQKVTDVATGEQVRLKAYDVDEVRCSSLTLDAIEAQNGATLDLDGEGKPTGSGKIDVDIRLDVTKGNDVWITQQSFLAFGNNKRKQLRSERESVRANGLVERMRAKQATSSLNALAGTDTSTNTKSDKPAVVASDAKDLKKTGS